MPIAFDHAVRERLATYAAVVSTSDAQLEGPVANAAEGVFERLRTVPNLFTLIRLLCLPWFLYLLFVDENRAGAAWLLAALGSTDWVDWFHRPQVRSGQRVRKDLRSDRRPTAVHRLGHRNRNRRLYPDLVRCCRPCARGDRRGSDRVLHVVSSHGAFWRYLAWQVRDLSFDGGCTELLARCSRCLGVPISSPCSPGMLGVPGLVLSYWTGFAYIPLIRSGLEVGRLTSLDQN